MNRKNHGRRQYAVATRTQSDPEGRRSVAPARYMLGPQHFSFMTNVAAGITQRPKVLLDVDCSNLLMGGSEQYENFSSTCWLEDHLHRFGDPVQLTPERNVVSSYEFHGVTELEASSSSAEIEDSVEENSGDSAEELEEDMPSTSSGVHGGGVSGNGNVINLHRFPYIDPETSIVAPPPYQDEPPPSYEEAIAGSSFTDHENSDFLW